MFVEAEFQLRKDKIINEERVVHTLTFIPR